LSPEFMNSKESSKSFKISGGTSCTSIFTYIAMHIFGITLLIKMMVMEGNQRVSQARVDAVCLFSNGTWERFEKCYFIFQSCSGYIFWKWKLCIRDLLKEYGGLTILRKLFKVGYRFILSNNNWANSRMNFDLQKLALEE
jgi:hypothetical protein